MKLFNNLFQKKEENIEEEKSLHVESDFSYFELVTQSIYEKCGISDLDKRALSSKMLQQMAEEGNIKDTNQFLHALKTNREFYQKVINIVTVNETFFMRELRELKWLIKYIKEENRPLKILSLPSSTGEEVYSILILLKEENVDLHKINITGHDINTDALEKAKQGLYKEYSLHKLDDTMKNKYFTKVGDKYNIAISIKEHAKFSQKNIFDFKSEHTKYDIILSRNMFIYFNEEKRKLATDIIVNSLKNGGIFIKGHADNISKNEYIKSLEFGI